MKNQGTSFIKDNLKNGNITDHTPQIEEFTGMELMMMGWTLGENHTKEHQFEVIVYPDKIECNILAANGEFVGTDYTFENFDDCIDDLERL